MSGCPLSSLRRPPPSTVRKGRTTSTGSGWGPQSVLPLVGRVSPAGQAAGGVFRRVRCREETRGGFLPSPSATDDAIGPHEGVSSAHVVGLLERLVLRRGSASHSQGAPACLATGVGLSPGFWQAVYRCLSRISQEEVGEEKCYLLPKPVEADEACNTEPCPA